MYDCANTFRKTCENAAESDGISVLAANTETALFAEWLDSIEDRDARSAFCYLVGIAICLQDYECRIQLKGDVRDFQFYNTAGEQLFSFITNQRWLLFYFRAPALRSGGFSFERLKEQFESLSENRAGEWTIRIRTIKDVDRLAQYLGWVTQ